MLEKKDLLRRYADDTLRSYRSNPTPVTIWHIDLRSRPSLWRRLLRFLGRHL